MEKYLINHTAEEVNTAIEKALAIDTNNIGGSEGSVKTIRLGKFDIDPMLIVTGVAFQQGTLYPRSFNQVFYIRNRDGEDVTEDVVNLPNGMYVFNTERVKFQSRPVNIDMTVEDAVNFYKKYGMYDQAVSEISEQYPDWTIDQIHEYMYQEYVQFYSGGSSYGSESFPMTSIFNAYAAFSRNYIIYIDRDSTCPIYNYYKEMYPSQISQLTQLYGEPDEELTWSVPTSAAFGGDMTFVEFRKDGIALGSTWLQGASGLSNMQFNMSEIL